MGKWLKTPTTQPFSFFFIAVMFFPNKNSAYTIKIDAVGDLV
jgi:hypothetical protein